MQKRPNISKMKKIIGLIILGIVLYNSVYFEKLSAHIGTTDSTDSTDSTDFIEKINEIIQKGVLSNPLLTEEPELIKQLNNNLTKTKKDLGNRLGIGESAHFLVKGSSTISAINEGEIQLANGSTIDTKFIFGNEVRDASRMVSLSDFKSQKDLNALTEALNNHLREIKIPKEVIGLKVGDVIQYVGACEIAPTDIPVKFLTIYPVEIKR